MRDFIGQRSSSFRDELGLTNEKADHNKPDNLYEPVSGDPGAHGRFDARAHPHIPQLWTDLHRNWNADGLLAAFSGWPARYFSRRKS